MDLISLWQNENNPNLNRQIVPNLVYQLAPGVKSNKVFIF